MPVGKADERRGDEVKRSQSSQKGQHKETPFGVFFVLNALALDTNQREAGLTTSESETEVSRSPLGDERRGGGVKRSQSSQKGQI